MAKQLHYGTTAKVLHWLIVALLMVEAILNYAALPPAMYGWRRHRIEYGFECACPETTIYLPPDFDDASLEKFLQPVLRQELADIARVYCRWLTQKLRSIGRK
jgi:hypothetical protein